jgi:hypothetical protein
LVDAGNGKIQVWVCLSTTNKAKYPQHKKVASISEYYLYKAIIKVIAAMVITGKIKVPEVSSAELSYKAKLKAYETKKKEIARRRANIFKHIEEDEYYPEEQGRKALMNLQQEEDANVPPVLPDEIHYPAVEKFKLPQPDLDFSENPVESHKLRKWKMAYIENQLLAEFQKENSKREWVESMIEKIELDENFTFYIYTKQGYIFEVKAPSRAPGHSRKTGELRPGRLEITPLT